MNETEGSLTVLQSIDTKLSLLVGLLAAREAEGLNSAEAIRKLGAHGLDADTISRVTGSPLSTVRPALSRAKSNARKTAGKTG